jgi:hypothetical protein
MKAQDHPVLADWEGEGLLWKRLIIRPNGQQLEGLLIDATPSFMTDKMIDLTRATTLDEAIEELKQIDWEYHRELTAYAEEG